MSKSRKTVLLISCVPPPLRGVELWTQTILKQGVEGGYEFRLIDEAKYHSVLANQPARFWFHETLRSLRVFWLLLLGLIRRPAVVHLNTYGLSCNGLLRDGLCLALARCFRVPTVTYYHNTMAGPADGKSVKRWQRLIAWTVRLSDSCMVLNKQSQAMLEGLVPAAKCGKVIVMPIFTFAGEIDTPRRQPDPTRPMTAIFVGALVAWKGYADLLAVAAKHPTIKFEVLGGKPHGEDLGNSEVPSNMTLHGAVEPPVVWDALARADVFFFPTHREGFPASVLEAMALGLPIISTRVGAIPEMVEHGLGGFLTEPGDIEGLSSALKFLHENTKARLEMGEHNLRTFADRYTYQRVTGQMVAVYDQLCHHNSANGRVTQSEEVRC